jgi:hypothetical protein
MVIIAIRGGGVVIGGKKIETVCDDYIIITQCP